VAPIVILIKVLKIILNKEKIKTSFSYKILILNNVIENIACKISMTLKNFLRGNILEYKTTMK